MPCYQIRTISVEFKVGNIDLLRKAIEKVAAKGSICEFKGVHTGTQRIDFYDPAGTRYQLNLDSGKLISTSLNETQLGKFSNLLKRAYSEQVIDEVARKQKWLKKKMGENRYQLQRF